MRKLLAIVALLGVMAFVTTDANAQRPPFGGGGGGGIMALLTNKSVQEELKITDEQKEKITEKAKASTAKFGEVFGKLKDVPKEERREKMTKIFKELQEAAIKEAGEILKPEQMKRIKQIERQQSIVNTLSNDDEVKKELKLTEEQAEKIKTISTDLNKSSGELKGFDKETFEKRATLRKEASEKAVAVLTDDQKKKWKDLTGEPFEVKREFTPRKKPTDN